MRGLLLFLPRLYVSVQGEFGKFMKNLLARFVNVSLNSFIRSSRLIWWFGMNQGALSVCLRYLFCNTLSRLMVLGAAPPHIGQAYVIVGIITDLKINSLHSTLSGVRRFIIGDSLHNLIFVLSTIAFTWGFHVSLLSKSTPRYFIGEIYQGIFVPKIVISWGFLGRRSVKILQLLLWGFILILQLWVHSTNLSTLSCR